MEYKIILPDEYPKKLKCIKKVPKILYAIGNVNLLYEDSFAIVGTRNPTEYGIQVCKNISKEFALREITIVSGMAIGIDQISHKIALDYGSKTIGILGCGIKFYCENGENKKLFYEIVKNGGLILSEYDFFVENEKSNFPQRNRIIAGLALGVLVIEAAFRSGSSITARYAKEYEKTVFAVPGDINRKMSVGTNNLIKKGAILTTNCGDIFAHYPQFANKKRKTISKKEEKASKIKKEWKEIIKFFNEGTNTIEELQIKSQKEIRILMKILCEMEIQGIITQESGIGYKLKEKYE